jgi:anti-anti-sigma factor
MEQLGFVVKRQDGILAITLSGNLDAKNAPAFSDELKKALSPEIKRIVFFIADLAYISSAGLRVIIFAKQKLGDDADILMVGARKDVLEVIRMSGLDSIIEFKDTYEV